MGSFPGHFLPGMMFIIYGFFELIVATRLQFARKGSEPSKCQKLFAAQARMVIPFIGIIAEISITSFKKHYWKHTNVFMHLLLYGFFSLSGFVDLLRIKRYIGFRNASVVMLTGAFLNEALMFFSHTTVQDMVEATFHLNLEYCIMWSAITVALYIVWPTSNMLRVSYATSLLVQGSWFIQIAFSIFGDQVGVHPPPYETMQKGKMEVGPMLISVLFGAHICLWIVFVVFVLSCCRCRFRCCNRCVEAPNGTAREMVGLMNNSTSSSRQQSRRDEERDDNANPSTAMFVLSEDESSEDDD